VTEKLIAMTMAVLLFLSTVFVYDILAQCGCPCGDICTTTSSTHEIQCFPYSGTWEGSCCDGGPKQVDFTCLPIVWQGRSYTCLPANVQHDWARFAGCVPCPPPE
jgi:hypothetical protein